MAKQVADCKTIYEYFFEGSIEDFIERIKKAKEEILVMFPDANRFSIELDSCVGRGSSYPILDVCFYRNQTIKEAEEVEKAVKRVEECRKQQYEKLKAEFEKKE